MRLDRRKILIVVGTRPEAIKIAPVLRALRGAGRAAEVEVCVTRQHSELLDPVLELFGIRPAFDLALMKPNQGLADLTSRALVALDEVYTSFSPTVVVVQGDTTTALAASLSAFYRRVPVAHVEAGLRTADLMAPWPEELNRRLTGVMASIHFAPTKRARQNLLREGVAAEHIHVTGNTAVDAILSVVERLRSEPGVGGHCIAVGPWFIVHSAPQESTLIRAAREVNDAKPQVVHDEVARAAKAFTSPVIACLGLAFKPDIDDLRESPALAIVTKLGRASLGRLLVVEPHISALPPPLAQRTGLELAELTEAVARADIVVFLVNHKAFTTIQLEQLESKLVVNACGWRQ